MTLDDRDPGAGRSPTVRLLTVSGSLRAVSANGAVLEAVARLAPPGVRVTRFDRLADLPAFNPDLDVEGALASEPVGDWRRAVAAADALMICSPEYAHGVPGALKNALDWLVSGPDVPGLPVAVVNATPRASIAHASLIETLRTMSASVVEAASVRLPLSPVQKTAAAILGDPAVSAMLAEALDALLREVGRTVRRVHGSGQAGSA